MPANNIERLLEDFALQLALSDENDQELFVKARKMLASVCASDAATNSKPLLNLSKELIRLYHVMEGGATDLRQGLQHFTDGIGILQRLAHDGETEFELKAMKELHGRISQFLDDESAASSAHAKEQKPDAKKPKKSKKASAPKKAASQPEAARAELPAPTASEEAASAASEETIEVHEIAETSTELITDDAELYIEFLAEAEEHLQSAEGALLDLESDPEKADSIDTVFRGYHTIKGVAGFLGLKDINRLTHDAETLLDCCRKGKIAVSAQITDLAFETIDALRALIGVVEQRVHGSQASVEGLPDIERLRDHLRRSAENDFSWSDVPTGDEADEHAGGPSIDRPVGEILLEQGSVKIEELEAALGKQMMREPSSPVGEILIKDSGVPPKKVAEAIREQKQSGGGKKGVGTAVKVDTEKLDVLVNMVGELVIAQTQVAQGSVLKKIKDEKLTKDLAQLNKITKDIQEIAMSMRMIPVKETFQKMQRLVRDLSKKSQKEIVFSMSGEETELDRNMVEEIGDPLVHILRNSVDHGIESTEERIAAGKPAAGKVELNAYHQGGNIVIEVRDDGRGLNRDKILQKAIERGLVRADEQLTDGQIYGFIFNAGLSTAEKITDVSGRGVGMDVVRQNVEKLRGKVEVSSEFGVGTVITVKLPLTLAIIDGMIVMVGEERYIVPTITIVETIQPQKTDIYSISGKGEMVSVRGNLYRLIRLYEVFRIEPRSVDPSEALVVIVENDTGRCCLQVDELLGQQQVVIKSLGEQMRGTRGISGGAILADGRVGLILDVSSLTDLALNGSQIDKKANVLVADPVGS